LKNKDYGMPEFSLTMPSTPSPNTNITMPSFSIGGSYGGGMDMGAVLAMLALAGGGGYLIGRKRKKKRKKKYKKRRSH
jgi:hypothetical protein